MAWSFDESNDYVNLGDDPRLDFQSGDWCIGGWLKIPDNLGSNFQYFFSYGGFGASPSLNWYFEESDSGSANTMRARIDDGDGDIYDDGSGNLQSSTTPGTRRDWLHALLVRSGDTCTMYVDASSVASVTNANFDTAINPSGDVYLGARSDLNADRYYGGDMAEWFKADVALDAGQRAALAAGASPPLVVPEIWSTGWYCPMVRRFSERTGLTVSTAGGPSVAAHYPGIIYPSSPRVMVPSADEPAAAVIPPPLLQPMTVGI